MIKTICFSIDAELLSVVDDRVAAIGVSRSAFIREALHTYLGSVQTPYERGWREGFNSAWHDTLMAIQVAVSRLREAPENRSDPSWDEPPQNGDE
jgi:hypothetical protein